MASTRHSCVRRLAALVLLGAASIPLLPAEAPACSNAPADVLELRAPADAQEGEAPGSVEVREVTVTRGAGPTDAGCGRQMQTSCDDLGTITLTLRPAVDPDSSRLDVGYVIAHVDGTLPEGLQLPDAALRGGGTDDEVSLTYRWIDGSDDEQEPVSFTVTLTAVDADGNRGAPSEPIAIVEPGR